ncbi:tannase/feruloyl esterase family alpha/beta hydrolase [Actinomadura sp. 6K520]|uniref:tannase/feruloyl esterase family alpha/beta hydrolase n=1 Tax=Actinomadura sp. 6K520 TaxID=2530364 RepID=UPI0010523F84|nr:tannase/feruloyl esterase family alpha/beta hydrolase [Actinomadura sp. 6K520]TDE37215.1 tannase/feruloyl esterase family alpha/beta hydrolase [Actinomadura sp. 6K520]
MSILRRSSVFSAAVVTLLAAPPAAAVPAAQADTRCHRMDRIEVSGAQKQVAACLDDLTTTGTVTSGHTDPAQWTGLHAAATRNPSGIPGIQVDGYFPDSSTFNTTHGWNHDSQFVIRLPENWNGGLVVSGAPGTRRQYANDFTISDWVLAKGYAFASTDKGNNGNEFFKDGRRPGDAIREWYRRMTQLTVAAKVTVARHYGKAPRRTYAAGISNGGQLVRWALENHPELYDGGIDNEGTYWPRDNGPNALTYLPTALRNYPEYKETGDPRAHARMIEAGFAPGSEFLWDFNYTVIWDNTQRIYREEIDPTYDGDLQAGIPYCESGTPNCDTDYRYHERPRSVHRTVRKQGHTGRIGKPMITVHGTLDSLLPIKVHGDAYAARIREQGRGELHRYYRIEGASHLDLEYDMFSDRMRPLLPCMRTAFDALERWTAPHGGQAPPPSATIPRQTSGDVANTCSIG